MDHGTLGLDAYYDLHQRFFDLMMRDKGYTGLNYASRVFPGAMHDEAAWADRLDVPLVFLAGRVRVAGGQDELSYRSARGLPADHRSFNRKRLIIPAEPVGAAGGG
jgi:hypothetical protein